MLCKGALQGGNFKNEGKGFPAVQVKVECWGGIYRCCLVAGQTSPEEGDLPGRGAQQLHKENGKMCLCYVAYRKQLESRRTKWRCFPILRRPRAKSRNRGLRNLFRYAKNFVIKMVCSEG